MKQKQDVTERIKKKNMAEKETFLGTEPVGRLIRKMALPSIVGVLAYNIYNLADTFFIARGVGTEAAGGLAVSFPLFVFLSAVTTTLGSGAASVISRALGEKDGERASRAVGNSFAFFLAVALLVTVFGLLFLDPLLYLMGVTPSLLPYARTYLRIILLGAVTCTGFSNLIRAEGSSRYAMCIWVIPLSINMVLDPVLIFGFDMGIAGAAIGTVAAQCVSMGMSVWYFFLSPKRTRKIRLRHFRPDFPLLREILLTGLPSFLQTMGYSIAMVVVNRLLREQGGDLAISTYGIVSKIWTFLGLCVTGLVQGVQPIVGYNFGEKKFGRVRETMRKSCGILGCYGIGAFLLMLLGAPPITGIFTSDEAVIGMGGHILRIFAAGTAFSGIQAVQTMYFQAVGKKKTALFLSLCGNVLCLIPLLTLLSGWMGLDGIWYAFPLANVTAAAISTLFIRRALSSNS